MNMLSDCVTNMIGITLGTLVVLWGGNAISSITIAFIYCLIKKRPGWKQILLGIVCIVIVIQTNVILPEEIFKDVNSPYAFTNKGYYQQFDVAFPNDTDQ